MQTRRILIIYGTRYGQTAKIADHMDRVLSGDGFEVTTCDAATPKTDVDPEHYDGVLVGGSLISGHHQRSITRWVTRHRTRLNAMPAGFFSVSGSAASADARGQTDARIAMEKFLKETHWEPDMMMAIGGAMAFTKYSFLLRWVMREISRRAGGPTDTSKDHELTDWDQVTAFAHRFGHVVAPTPLVAMFADR